MNNLSARPQYYTNFLYFDTTGKEYKLGRLQLGNFGIPIELVEHVKDGKDKEIMNVEELIRLSQEKTKTLKDKMGVK